MNSRLDGAFQGQEPLTGTSPLGVFTILTTFRRACDAAGLSHGQVLPLLAFRLSGAAKRAFSSALNSKAGRCTYAILTYGAAINWLLAKYVTHAVMASACNDIITMRQPDNESPTAFGLRVETQCDRLDGLFHAQDVKDVFINGLSEIIQSHVQVLDGQFPKRTLADTISAAQMYWDETNKLRLSLKLPRLQTTKMAYASPMQTRHSNVERPLPVTQPRARSRSPPPKDSPHARTDICYNCNKPCHFVAQCAEPYQPRQRRPPIIAGNSVTEDTKTTAESDSNESTDSKNESAGCALESCPAHHRQLVNDVKSQGYQARHIGTKRSRPLLALADGQCTAFALSWTLGPALSWLDLVSYPPTGRDMLRSSSAHPASTMQTTTPL